jgi:hypothetical protein
MSVVTGVTLISQCCDEHSVGTLVNRLNVWIRNDPTCGPGSLKRVDEHYGGGKHPENFVWGAGLNYLSWNEFIKFAKGLPWRDALTLPDEERVILVVSPDQRPAEVIILA